jgi:hypothetical protein
MSSTKVSEKNWNMFGADEYLFYIKFIIFGFVINIW